MSAPTDPTFGYPSVGELVAESTVTALTSLSADQQEDLYELSVNAVEEFCGQKFDYEPGVSHVISGSGSDVLYLPKRLGVLTSLYITNSALTMSDVILQPPYDRLVVKPDVVGSMNYYEQALVAFEENVSFTFTYDENNVTITGDWGWEIFPNAVRTALRRDMEDTALADANALSDSIRAFRKLGLRDVSQGNLRTSIEGAGGLAPEITLLLSPYVWEGQVGVSF